MLQALNTCDTAIPLQSLLLDALDAITHEKPLDSIGGDPLVKEVAEAQAQVGWHQIRDSCVSGSRHKTDTT
jgi:hypothetical protein